MPGRRPLPWIKVWFDTLNDVKMNRLSAAERWCWIGILLLAGQSPVRGKLLLTESDPMTTEDIATALHLTAEELPALESCISKLVALKSLKWNNHCLEVINFKKRQEVYESDFKDYHKTQNNSELTPEKVLKEEEVDVEVEVENIFNLWNSLGVIKHRKLSGQVMRAIKATLRDFSAAEISQAMKNYALILNDQQCFFKYKWTLKDFLKRGLEKFLDLEIALNNYRKEKASGADKKHSEPTEKWDPSKPLRPATGNLGDWSPDKSLR
jgi:hypothetical protein